MTRTNKITPEAAAAVPKVKDLSEEPTTRRASSKDKGKDKKGKKGAAKSPSATKSHTNTKTQIQDLDPNMDGMCRVCVKGINDKTESSIYCDRCNGCIHLKCTKLTKEEFNYTSETRNSKLFFYCSICDKELNQGNRDDDAVSQQNAKIQNLTELTHFIIAQNKLLLEEIQTKNKVILQEIQTTKKDDDIQIQLEEVIVNQSEVEEKKKNLIVFNLPEAQEENEEEDDHTQIKEVLAFLDSRINTEAIDMKKIERMGKRKGKDDRPRAIKVELPSVETKFKAIRSAQKLKDYKIPKIGISFDKTKKEMDEDIILRKKPADAKTADPTGDYVIFKKEVVTRAEATRLKGIRDANRGKPRFAHQD